MIRKFVMGAALLMLATGTLFAQQAPEPQQPSTSSSQETQQEEEIGPRKPRARDYQKWQFNVGAGANLGGGTTHTYVRGGGISAGGGVARNYSK